MSGKLSDLERKQIVAEYVAGDGKVSQRKLAERYQVSQKTISTILKDGKTTQKVSQKKIENALTMCAFLEARTVKAQELIDKILELLPSDLGEASVREKAGLLKILAEVFTGKTDMGEKRACEEEYSVQTLKHAFEERQIGLMEDNDLQ